MATFDSILSPGEANGTKIAALATTTASAAQDIGTNVKFVIVADDAVTIRFGAVGAVTDPTVASFLIPANVPMVFDTGRSFGSFKVFNIDTSTTTDIHYLRLSHF